MERRRRRGVYGAVGLGRWAVEGHI